MRAAITKMQGYTARIAGILHVLWDTASGQTPEPLISIERVKAAKALAEFYLGQVHLIRADSEAVQGELTPLLEKILGKARQLGHLPTRIAKTSIKALRNVKTDKILEFFKELEATGHARLDGKTLIVQNVDRNADHVDPTLTEMLTTNLSTRSINGKSFQPFADKNVDHVDYFAEQKRKQSNQELPEICLQPALVATDLSIIGQQSQQVNIMDESPTQLDVDHVDRKSTWSTFSETVADLRDKPLPVTVEKYPKLRIGDRCRYAGPEGAMAVTCRGKSMDLEVKSLDGVMMARVKATAWAVDYWVPFQHLKRDRYV